MGLCIQSEATLMQGIVPEKHQRRIFDQLIQSGLDLVIKEGEVWLLQLSCLLICMSNVLRDLLRWCNIFVCFFYTAYVSYYSKMVGWIWWD